MFGVVLAVGLGGNSWAADPAPSSGGEVTNAGNMRAVIKTKFGDIEIKFLPDVAPKHVDNFIKLAKTGFYNGTIFHRVIPGFMIRGRSEHQGFPEKGDLWSRRSWTERQSRVQRSTAQTRCGVDGTRARPG